eukprot:c13043_g1_i1.p1 GENE.c13043_g1_i1~~c13043_g1_i1.p1  ORF type:complete len:280 (+),score=66.40 c13043_g1_i1:2-841(+)
MEDAGTFDQLLEREGFQVKKKPPAPTPREITRNSASSEGMTVHMTRKFAVVKWDPNQIAVPGHSTDDFEWLLTMNSEPIYVGPATSYVVANPTPSSHHHFELRALNKDEKFVSLPNGEEVLSTVFIVAPDTLERLHTPQIGRVLSIASPTPHRSATPVPPPQQPVITRTNSRINAPMTRTSSGLKRAQAPQLIVTAPVTTSRRNSLEVSVIPETPRNVRADIQGYSAPSMFLLRRRSTNDSNGSGKRRSVDFQKQQPIPKLPFFDDDGFTDNEEDEEDV